VPEERPEPANVVALRKRLATCGETIEDRQTIERVARLRALRAANKTFDECAVEMGEKAGTLSKFARSETYAAIVSYIDAAEDAADEKSMERAVRRGRIDSAALVPLATRYISECFERHPAGTKLMHRGREIDVSDKIVDDGKAMWAVERLKSTGFLEAVPVAKSTPLPTTIINQTIYLSRGDDDQAAKAARAVIDVTPESAS